LTDRFRIRSAIVVEASPRLEDNQWLLDLAAREPFLAGVVGHLDPAEDAFARHLDRFARDPLFVGIRIGPDDLRRGLEEKKVLDNLRLLIRHDRELDVNGGPVMPADVARLARLLPELRIVINHAANLPIDGKAVPADWLRGMRAAAAGKQVFCKVSALVEGTRRARGDVPTDVDYYGAVLDALWDVFGEDRLIYASNWPVSETSASYATVHGIVHTYFRKKGERASEKFFLRNAQAAYKPADRSRK
jgi:predicted TIM-barrel fold metal-dependent hydrolase